MFEYEGEQYTLQDLKTEADRRGLSLGDFVSKMKDRGMIDLNVGGLGVEEDSKGAAGNWFSDAWFAGKINADMYDDADNVFDIGNAKEARELTNEQLNTYIGLLQKSKTAAGEMKEAQKFAEAYNKYDSQGENMIMSTIMGIKDVGIKGFAQNMIQSMRGQFNKQQLLESGAAAAGTYATTQLAGLAGGPVGAVAGFFGGATGAVTSAFAAANYGMETIHMFNQLLEEEIEKKGLDFTPESIRKIMSDDEVRSRIKSKARKRGATIGTVEGITSLVGMKGATNVIKSGMKTTSLVGKTARYLGAGTITTTAEIVGGGGGEYLGAKAAGMEATGLDIVNEAFSGVATTAPISTAVSGAVALANRPSYFVEGKKVTKKSLLDYTDRAQTPQELADLNFEIKNDALLDADLKQKQLRASIDVQIDPSITNVDQRNKLIDLQIEKNKLEANKKKKGVFKVLNNDKKLQKVDQDIDNILSNFEGLETTAVKEQLEKGVQQYSIQKTIQLLENEAGPIPNVKEAFSVENNDAAQAAFEKVRAEFGLEQKDVTDSDGFIIPTPEGNVIVINKDIAGKTGQINVGGHELLHAIVQKHYESLGDGSLAQKKFIEDFKNTISKKSLKYIQDIIDRRNRAGEEITTYSDEYLTIYSDGIIKNQIGYDESVGVKLKNFIQNVARKFGYNKEFESGLDTYNFMRDYNNSIIEFNRLSDRAKAVAGVEAVGTEVKKSMTAAQKAEVKQKVDKLGQVDTDGNNLREKGTGNFYYQAEVDNIIKEIKEKGYLNALIRAQYKADIVPVNFVDDVITQLTPDIKNFKPEQNESLFGYLQGRIKFRAGDVYNKIYKAKEETKKARDIGETTKEGDVKIQVAAETDAAMEALETEDLSPAAQAKKRTDKAKSKQRVESEFRRKIGIETGSELYNKVLDSARKALLRAYEAGTSARNIQRKLRDEANIYLFKSVKNFLGTKDYIKNLKKFREPIVKAIFTADLVQLERNVADSDRILTTFVKKLTSKQDVENAVNQKLLPPSALNIIDKGTAVSLYKKKTPTEKQFLDFFYAPLINPVTGSRSGLRGTRKDGLAKAMAGALSYDATMEVAQEQDVIEKREQLAALKGETLAQDNLETLAAAINRDPSVKFSKSTLTESKRGKAALYLQAKENSLIDGHPAKPFFELTRKLVEEQMDVVDALTISKEQLGVESEVLNLILKDGNLNNSHVDNIVWAINNFVVAKIRKLGHDTSVKYLKNQLKEKSTPEKISIVNEYLANVGRSLRSAKVDDITTNALLLEQVIQKLGDKKLANRYSLKDVLTGQKIQYKDSAGNVKDVELYENIENIKNNAYNNSDLTKKVNDQAKKAQAYIFKILDSNLTNSEKKAVVQLMAYDQRGALRKVSKLGMVVDRSSKFGKKYNSKNTVLEHELTSKDLQDKVNDYIDGKIKKETLQETFDKATVHVLPKTIDKILSAEGLRHRGGFDRYNNAKVKNAINKLVENKTLLNAKFSKSIDFKNLNKAIAFSRSANNPTKGITILDFDDTLATTKSLVKFTRPDGTTGTLNAEQYASTYEDLLDQGYTFDFSEFNKVVKGKLAPLFQKALKLQGKFGPENMFVLTARPPAAQKAIFDFLKANGLNIPLKNITGLGNSTAEAKALWVADKVGEGYNDFYFADDALQNVQAVKNMLDQFDVKSKVQQAKVKFSKNMNDQFNDILEDVTGIEAIKRFSAIKARKRGASKGKFRFFIPPSHEDFVGLLYNFMGKGRRGDEHRNFFEEALVRPLNRAYREIDTAKQAIANDYKQLNKQFEDVKGKLNKKTPDGDFIFEDAIRVYLWNKHGYEIAGLSETDQANLVEIVQSDPNLQAYAENLNVISKQEKYIDPGQGWEGGNIKTDLMDATGRVGRAEYFAEFNENADILFSEENLNKIEAGYGADFRSALEDILHRTKTGVNRPKGQTATTNKFMNYLNGSVGAVMFFNTRSAILQQMSIVNYINFADNNIFAAAKAFANQKQYWKDFAFIFNSDMLKQRRGGIGTDINGADLAQAVKGSKNPTKIVIGKLLKLGFLPTQIGDNIAIATGGATYYRNRVNKYVKDGLSQKEAEAKAFTDFQDLTQSTQQSSRPDMTSQQQASWIGKLVLNFQNITSQYNRIIKKAALDIGKGRISPPYTSKAQSNLGNLSKILYYGAVQNVIFYSLQTALFAVMFDEDEDEDQILKKRERVIQGSIDSILRGSGIYGAVLSTLKNAVVKWNQQRDKKYNKDESAVLMELLNFSPVVGIKARKLVNAEKTINYNENVMREMETFDADNPQWSAVTNYTEALTNFPANRLYQKSINMRNALDKDYTMFQRIMFFSGYTTWSLGLGDNEAIIEAKEKVKINKANTKKKKSKVKKFKVKKFKVK